MHDTHIRTDRPGVLILVSSLRFGGAEKHAIALANQLDANCFRVHLCHIKPDAHLAAELAPERRATVMSLGVRGKFSWRAVKRLKDLITAQQIDVVVCANGYPMWYALLAARKARRHVRFVEVLHTTIVSSWKSRAVMFLNRLVFTRADLLVFVSHRQQLFWTSRGMRAKRQTVIQNGIDADWFTDRFTSAEKAACRARYGFGPEDYVIGICAALRPEKAHGDLLAASRKLRDAGIEAKTLIIGDGRERQRIERQIEELNLSGVAAVTGYQSDVRLHIAACDVMVLASHAIETFSIASLESMSMGKPVVLSRIGGAEEQVVEGANGFLFEPGDIDALSERLRSLADAEQRRRMGVQAARLVRERFTTERMTAAYERELMQLAGSLPRLSRVLLRSA